MEDLRLLRRHWAYLYRQSRTLAIAALGAVSIGVISNCAASVSPVPLTILTIKAYEVTPTLTTPGGVRVDASGMLLPMAYLEKIDRITAEAFACLNRPRQPITLKIPADWMLSCDQSQQVLPVAAGYCDPRKPENCKLPCAVAHWRAFVQPDASIVSAPSLYLYKDPLVRMLTGVQDIWSDAKLAPCATPTSTRPLDTW